jgi:5'-nucleotidase
MVSMRILISNDDGIYSPGIAALAEIASEFGTVRVVAPDMERSSTGHAITHHTPLSYRATHIRKDLTAYRVNGTPADCVALGAHLWEKVDLVLSGLNHGLNLGNSIWHSGTLAAAKQAVLLGLRGVALSMPSSVDDLEPYKPWVRRALQTVIADADTPLINVNFPRQPRGMVWTRVSVRKYDGRIVPAADPAGRPIYWFTVTPQEGAEEGTDRWAVEQNWISLTPISLDLTDMHALANLRISDPLDQAVATAISPPKSSPEDAQAVREDEREAPIEDHPPATH